MERSRTFLTAALYSPYRFFVTIVSSSACPMMRQTCCSLSFIKHSAGCFVQQPKQPWQGAYFPSAGITLSYLPENIFSYC